MYCVLYKHCLKLAAIMNLKDMARTKGRNLSTLGIHPVYASQINAGVRRAGAKTINKIAGTVGLPTDFICAVCEECWSRAHPAPSIGPGSPGPEPATVGHGGISESVPS
jgi:hypothetical protein